MKSEKTVGEWVTFIAAMSAVAVAAFGPHWVAGPCAMVGFFMGGANGVLYMDRERGAK